MSETDRPEVCVCAAIQMPDGYIVRGHRHHDCLRTAADLRTQTDIFGVRPRYPLSDIRAAKQGFVTTLERFVDRDEGLRLQLDAGRPPVSRYGNQLYSEDLY